VVGCVQGEWGRGGGDAPGACVVVVVDAPSASRSACRCAPGGYAFAAHAGTYGGIMFASLFGEPRWALQLTQRGVILMTTTDLHFCNED
jgi:hypothetical protein